MKGGQPGRNMTESPVSENLDAILRDFEIVLSGGSLRSVDWSRETLQPFEKNFYKASEASRWAEDLHFEID